MASPVQFYPPWSSQVMKNMKCYGRKQVIIPKEKSFIKKFFDGNTSSEISFLNSNPKKEVTRKFFRKERDFKENFSESETSSDSLHLFEEVVLEKKPPEKSTCFGASNGIKNKQVKEKKKCVKRKKFVQRKQKGIQHLSTKFCKSHQPRWSEINSHKFTVESQGGYIKHAFSGKPSNILNHGRISHSKYLKQNSSGIDSCKNLQKKGRSRKHSISNDNELSSNDIWSTKAKMVFTSQESLDSSSDLFLPTIKIRKPMKVRKSIHKNNSNGFIYKKRKDENFSQCTVNELEEKISQCMELVKSPSACEKKTLISENSTHKKCDKKLASHSPHLLSETEDLLSLSTNPLLLVHVADKSSLKNKQACDDLCKFSVHENIGTENGFQLNLDASNKSHDLCLQSFDNKNCTPVDTNDLQDNFNTKQNCSGLDRSLNKDSKREILLQITDSLGISGSVCSKENLNESDISQALFSMSNRETDINPPITHTKNVNVCSLAPYLNESCKLNTDNFFSGKECIQGSDGSKSNSATGKNFQNAALSIDALSVLECSKIKELDNISKIRAHVDGDFIVNISPNVSFIDKCWKSTGNKSSAKFVTSTPVIKNKFLSSCDAKFSVNKTSKSRENSEDANLQKKPSYSVYLNLSTSNEIQKSLQLFDWPVMVHSKKSSTLPKVNMADSLSLKRNSSLLNLSSLPDKEDSCEFTRDELLKLCDQDSVASFAEVYNWKEYNITKIGEGTYGEVFKLTKDKVSVLKIIPVSEDPSNKHLQGLSSVYSEVKITKCLSELRNNLKNQSQNFTKVLRVSVASGTYPAELIAAWDGFNESTYNDRPDVYSNDQLFVILELEFGGIDLSHFTINNAVEAESILKQIAISLAIAEEEFSFEHRDLHLGNILIVRNKFPKTCVYKLRGQDISFPSHSVHVIIIDFTLSLLHENGYVYYNDLAEDVSLFEQSGDYQFEVYKAMRNHLQNKWQDSSLYSNILWLKYLCQKMKEYKYKNSKSKLHKKGLKAIEYFNNQLLNCNCALECLAKCGITENAFKKTASRIRKNSILVSRNSSQKSKLSICN